MPEHKESYYQARIIKWLRTAYPDAFAWKAQAGPYSRQGIPDICAVINGHFFGFEVKRPEGGKLSAVQAQTIKQIMPPAGRLRWLHTNIQLKQAIRAGLFRAMLRQPPWEYTKYSLRRLPCLTRKILAARCLLLNGY